jgi:hypothetical protein
MAMMGPPGILLFTRPAQRTRPETREQERQPRNRPRIDAVIRIFRRRSRPNFKLGNRWATEQPKRTANRHARGDGGSPGVAGNY